MKLSKILRTISIIAFWSDLGLFVHWLFTLTGEIWAVIVMSAATAIATVFARMPENKGFSFLFHLTTAAIPGILAATDKIAIPMMLFGMVIVIASYIAKVAESDIMDKGNGFCCFLLVVMYLVGSVMGYELMWLHFGLMVMYIFLVFIEINIHQNEDYLEKVSYHSVIDNKKISGAANMVSLSIGLIMLVVCVSFALLGKIGPLAAFSAFLRLKWKELLNFLKRINYKEEDDSGVGDIDSAGRPPEDELAPEGTPEEELPVTVGDAIVTALLYSFIICVFLYGVYAIIKRIYKKYLQFKSADVTEEEVYIKKKKTKKINPAKLDKSYSNRTAIRKIYKKRIKGRSFGRRDDLNNCTPMEQRDKSMQDGNEVSNELVEMYEKARYSNESISKEDVKKMNKL